MRKSSLPVSMLLGIAFVGLLVFALVSILDHKEPIETKTEARAAGEMSQNLLAAPIYSIIEYSRQLPGYQEQGFQNFGIVCSVNRERGTITIAEVGLHGETCGVTPATEIFHLAHFKLVARVTTPDDPTYNQRTVELLHRAINVKSLAK